MGTERRERQKANRQIKHETVQKQVRRRNVTRKGVIIAIAGVAVFIALVLIAVLGGDDDDTQTPTTTVAAAVPTDATDTTDASDTTVLTETTDA